MNAVLPAHQEHSRSYEDFRFVYPVLSRRSGGISVGINTNPDKGCNFDCVYCQVDRLQPALWKHFDLATAEWELKSLLAQIHTGDLRRHPPFAEVPSGLCVLKDIALSGDGEPTALKNFAAVVEMIARVKPPEAKLVLITNATGLHRADVRRGLEIMDRNQGEIWAKLDVGTESYFQTINRAAVSFERILANIRTTARQRAVVIQSLFVRLAGRGPSPEEIDAYCQRLVELQRAGGPLDRVQITTLARRPCALLQGLPAQYVVNGLHVDELVAIANRVRQRTGLAVECFPGLDPCTRRTP